MQHACLLLSLYEAQVFPTGSCGCESWACSAVVSCQGRDALGSSHVHLLCSKASWGSVVVLLWELGRTHLPNSSNLVITSIRVRNVLCDVLQAMQLPQQGMSCNSFSASNSLTATLSMLTMGVSGRNAGTPWHLQWIKLAAEYWLCKASFTATIARSTTQKAM